MTYQLQAFDPNQAADPSQARFDRTALWGEAVSTKRNDYISTDKGMFAAVVGGQQLGQRVHSIDVVILKQSPDGRTTSRTFFQGNYDPNNTTLPACHSDDGVAPATNSKFPQSASCAMCPQNAAGSGATAGSRACRFGKTLAVAVPEFGNKVFEVKLSAQALFAQHDPSNNTFGLFAFDAVLGRRIPQEVLVTLSQPEGATGGVRITPKGMLDVQTATGYVQMSQDPAIAAMLKHEPSVVGLALSRTQALPAPAQAQPNMTFGQPVQQFAPAPQQFAPAPQQFAPAPQQFAPAPQQFAPAPQQPVSQAVVYPAALQQAMQPPVYAAPPVQQVMQPPVYAAPPVQQVMTPPPMVIPPVPHQVAQPIENVAPPTAVVKQEAPAVANPVYVDRLAAAFASR